MVLATLGRLTGCAEVDDSSFDVASSGESDDGGEELGSTGDEVINGYDATGHSDGVVRLATWSGITNVTECSAVMLTNQWAATLASCIAPAERADPTRLRLLSPDGPAFIPREVIIHPDASRDLALVRLSVPMIIYGSATGTARQQSGQPLAWLSGRAVRCYGYGPTQAGGANSAEAT